MRTGKYWIVVYPLTILAVLLLVHWGSRAVTTLSESYPIEREYCIIIDPGHGGEDGGATSCTGLLESAYNLEISLCLDDLFHLLGYDTKMLRKSDVSIYTKGETIGQKKISDLKERVRIVNETENAVLLSIHQNQFSDPQYSGAQVFYSSTEYSDAFAKLLQSAFCTSLDPGNHRKAKKSEGVYLMDRIHCAGVLIECGFLSNPEEEAKLRDREYQQKLCCVIASATDCFLSNA